MAQLARARRRPGLRSRSRTTCTPRCSRRSAAAGIESLWAHQADALEAARRGHAIVTTGTASGKSLAFNLPVLDTLASDLAARAFYLYPTKALAQDQARKLARLGGRFLRHAIYDGDTPREERRAIRQRSNLILTNPDMLHVGVLPNHRSWGDVLANLAWVVVDEAHVYRGVFGSHVANVLRRLRRLARAYGSRAALRAHQRHDRQPGELAERLTGLEVRLVDRDGAPRAERQIAMWNPPLIDERLGKRASALSEAAELLAELVERDVRTICFLKSRRGVELIQRFARLRLEDAGRPDLAERIAPYRAGYTPAQRREIERRLVGGRAARGGGHQRARAGHRRRRPRRRDLRDLPGHRRRACARCGAGPGGARTGLAMYVAGEDALDQFFCRHPDEFLERPVERAILDHESEEIHLAHLAAAAYELPLTPEDGEVFGPRWEDHAQRLVKRAELRERGGRYLPRGPGYPGGRIALRSASPDSVAIVEADGRRGDRQRSSRRGRTRRCTPARSTCTWAPPTRWRSSTWRSAARSCGPSRATGTPSRRRSRRPGSSRCASSARPAAAWRCRSAIVSVTEQVVAYQKKRVADHSVLDLLALDMPEQEFVTQALWYELPDELLREEFPLEVLQGSLHAAEHGQIAVLPLIAMCDRWDIGGLSTAFHHQTGRADDLHLRRPPRRRGDHARGLRALRGAGGRRPAPDLRVPLPGGCPSCVQSPKCGNLNEPLNKRGAIELLSGMASAEGALGGVEHRAAVLAGGLVQLDRGGLGGVGRPAGRGCRPRSCGRSPPRAPRRELRRRRRPRRPPRPPRPRARPPRPRGPGSASSGTAGGTSGGATSARSGARPLPRGLAGGGGSGSTVAAPRSGSSSSSPCLAASAALDSPSSHTRSVRRTGSRASERTPISNPTGKPYPSRASENAPSSGALVDRQGQLAAQLVRAGGHEAVEIPERPRE